MVELNRLNGIFHNHLGGIRFRAHENPTQVKKTLRIVGQRVDFQSAPMPMGIDNLPDFNVFLHPARPYLMAIILPSSRTISFLVISSQLSPT